MSAGIHVDTLGGLTEKLKQLINDTQEHVRGIHRCYSALQERKGE